MGCGLFAGPHPIGDAQPIWCLTHIIERRLWYLPSRRAGRCRAKFMIQSKLPTLAALVLLVLLTVGCTAASSPQETDDAVASADEMAEVADVVEAGMTPINGSQIKDGVYSVTVDSSSSMFQIVSCQLTVQDGEMTAKMTMGGTGYLSVFMGTGEEAAGAQETSLIPFEEDPSGAHTFTVPVEALDMGIPCAAFSKNKEKWYDRTLVFRADSLPVDAFAEGVVTTPDSLQLSDGEYQVEVSLEGGSGKASLESPARLHVQNGQVTATITWSSANYDYMKVDGVQYDAVITEGRSAFTIPVTCFDWRMAVIADTIAMSQPHEISYALRFDSASIAPAEI